MKQIHAAPALSRPPSLASLAETRLKDAIESAEFDLGAPLSEDKLATFLGISRTPVREALNALSLKGLVEIYPQRGSYVFSPSEEDVEQLCEFRMMMESKAMGLCLNRSKAETLRKLTKANAAMREACREKNMKTTAESDTAFHMAFFEDCENQFLQEAYALVSGRITTLRTHLVNPRTGISPHSVQEHDEIIAAFAAGNLAHAESIMSAHVYRMTKNYVKWKSEGDSKHADTTTNPVVRKRRSTKS
jgi:DNA-binding GntR family transcriptional regulator